MMKMTTSDFGDRLRVCRAISCRMPVVGVGLEAAGVDDEVRASPRRAAAVMAVAREAREVGDERVARCASGD